MTGIAKTATTGLLIRGARSGEIDALRCYAMLAVIALHTGLLPIGWMGVWLFYVISGYVVTASIARSSTDGPGRWLRTFYAKRFARIVPVYMLYVLVGTAVAIAVTGHINALTLTSLLMFFYNMVLALGSGHMTPWPVSHLWTISVEMQFYAVYGLLFVFLPRTALKKVLIALLVLSPAARAIGSYYAEPIFSPESAAFAIYTTSFFHFDAFAAGALLAMGGLEALRAREATPLFFGFGLGVIGLYCIVYFVVNSVYLGHVGSDIFHDVVSGILFGQGREVWLYSALAAVNAGLVAWTATGTSPWQALVSNRTVQWIGEISYGAYIFQALALWMLLYLTGLSGAHHLADVSLPMRLFIFSAAAALSIMAAAVSSRYFERPCISRVNAWLSRERHTKVEA